MYDQHKNLNSYYNTYVRLGRERRAVLAAHRDSSIERLKAGLDKLGYPQFTENCDQGSYAMHTLNQHALNAYDLDEAIVFDATEIPRDPLAARKRVEAAMIEGGGNFNKPPEAKSNAVRVPYAEGHHLDFAIYRRTVDAYGREIIEHAGPEWTRRYPNELTEWFLDQVKTLSPSGLSKSVDDGQLRRIVRWLKVFAKSRDAWNLPGGLIISVLAVESYRPDYHRDDVALYNTMTAILHRLQRNTHVWNPLATFDENLALTKNEKHRTRVSNLGDKLERALDKLAVVMQPNCTEEEAKAAWGWMFQHDFWGESSNSVGRGMRSGMAAASGSLHVGSDGKITYEKPTGSSVQPLPQRFYGGE